MDVFKEKAQYWASSFSTACILDSNRYQDPYGSYLWAISVGESERFLSNHTQTFEKLQHFIDRHAERFIPGFLSYDLKNEIEALQTLQPNRLGFDKAFFFVPQITILCIDAHTVQVHGTDAKEVIKAIELYTPDPKPFTFQGRLQARLNKDGYTEIFNKMKAHIFRGDIYEINLCQEFYADDVALDAFSAYRHLSNLSPTPFGAFFKYDRKFIISASPERFLKKNGPKLISQPIKGTAKRWTNPDQDRISQEALRSSPKEVSENVMIVDLVRHDMTKSALPASVSVKELLGVYSFKQVHQLISTIECNLRPDVSITDSIKNTFPPGSMTGAPKLRAMEIIDHSETSMRGVYSGAIGYFHKGNFDFSVVIRSLLYNASKRYLSFLVGGAITATSNVDDEYQECLLKASAIHALLHDPVAAP